MIGFLVCFSWKNGSLTRERIRDECADRDWDIFDQLLDSTPRGNFRNVGKCHRGIHGPLDDEEKRSNAF